MDWIEPKYSKTQVDKAGKILCEYNPGTMEFDKAMDILNNWRSIHSYPLNTFQSTLRAKIKKLEIEDVIVVQRLKRIPSIINKLNRYDTMKLSRMQDIGGLRTIVHTLDEVYILRNEYINNTRFNHKLISEYDYIKRPKDSGYRSIHLVYKYKNDKKPEYNGLLLEVQIRSEIQHAWATAVETMGIFLNSSLKSSEGPKKWLDFFALAGSAFAFLENSPRVPIYAHLTKEQTFERLLDSAEKLDAKKRLDAFSLAAHAIIKHIGNRGNYHLIILYTNEDERHVEIYTYGRKQLEKANEDYKKADMRIEKGENIQAVLVSASSFDTLKWAYPNFFLNAKLFIEYLSKIEDELKYRKS